MLDTPLSVSTTHKPGDSYVQSFARGLEVIRSFNASAPQQTLSEVAARTGLTRAGARRILLTLQTLGYLESDGRLFRLTPRILDLGFAYLSSTPVWNLAEPVMENLVDEVKESCSAAVLDGSDIVYVLRIHTHKIMSTNLAVGSRLPAHATVLGRVLLQDMDAAQLQATATELRVRHWKLQREAGVELPPSLEKFDKAMGQNMRYYTERVAVRVRLAGANQTVKLVATAQGCAAIVGVCYAPITKAFSVPAMGGKQG